MTKKLTNLVSMLICRVALIISFVLFVVGCASPTTIPTLTSIPTAHLPTSTIESISTPTEIPLSLTGPWLVFVDDNHLYALNKNGTGLTSLVPGLSVWQVTSPPRANIIAAVTYENNDQLSYAVTLTDLPHGIILNKIPLMSFFANDPTSFDNGPSGPFNGITGSDPDSAINWSPDGRYLAFMGAIENSLSSLYIYDSKLQTTKRLSQNQYQAVDPNWSPDGKWIVYEEVSDFQGWQTEGMWAASVDGDELKLLYRPKNGIEQEILGWVGKDSFIVADSGMDGERNIRVVNSATGNIRNLYSGYYSKASVDTKDGAVAFFPITGAPGAGSELEPGLYLVSPDIPKPRLIINPDVPFSPSLAWDSSTKLFVSEIQCNNEPEKTIAFDSSGKTMCIAPKPNVSPNGSWYIVENQQLSVYQTSGEKMGEFAGDNQPIIWSPDSDGFFFVTGNGLHHVSLPNMVFQNAYRSEKGYISLVGLVWVGTP